MGGPCLVHINFGKCKGGLECIDRVLQFCIVALLKFVTCLYCFTMSM